MTSTPSFVTSVAHSLGLVMLAAVLTVVPDAAYAGQGALDVIVTNIRNSVSEFPKLYAVFCYIFGLFLAVSAILKFKNHVDDARSESLRAPVVRLIIGGVLLSFPTVMEAMIQMIGESAAAEGAQSNLPSGGGIGLGLVIDNFTQSLKSPQRLFAVIAYLFGVGFGIAAAIEFIKTADSPGNNPIRKPVMLTITASALLAAPAVLKALKGTLVLVGQVQLNNPALGGSRGGVALDQILISFVSDLYMPLMGLLAHFCTIAGLAFMFVGIFRLTKGENAGPKAAWGSGTIGTFLLAAALMVIPGLMGSAQTSLFGSANVSTYAVLASAGGMDAMVTERANMAIQAVFIFVQIVGWFSFVRGFFILRDHAEGSGQASMSAGFTHIIGGAIAVNLSAFVNAVQQTLGLVGLTF